MKLADTLARVAMVAFFSMCTRVELILWCGTDSSGSSLVLNPADRTVLLFTIGAQSVPLSFVHKLCSLPEVLDFN